MRITRQFLVVAAFIGASQAPAGGLDLTLGAKFGMGGSWMASQAHPTQSNPTNLFSILAGQTTVTQESGLSGGFGFFADYGKKGIAEAELELWGVGRNANQMEDLGSGIQRGTQYSRDVLEGNLMLKLGYPFKIGQLKSFGLFADGGVFGNRTVNAPYKTIGLVGQGDALVRPWNDVVNEDWGWVAGAGFEVGMQSLVQVGEGVDKKYKKKGVIIGMECRYYEGQKDLDPKGVNELKSRTLMGILSFGL